MSSPGYPREYRGKIDDTYHLKASSCDGRVVLHIFDTEKDSELIRVYDGNEFTGRLMAT
ncbi:hypothetical protein AAVH_38877, partial [Aphelenchoides avenae]